MKTQWEILATVALLLSAAPVLAQTATDSATQPRPVARPLGAYDKLPDGEKRIVSAIYEAQLGSANDTASGPLLTRDEIAGLREKTGWANAYTKLHAKGMVTEKNLAQAISTYTHSIQGNRHITVINTGGGEQLAFTKDKQDNAPAPAAKPATAKPVVAKPAAVTTATSSAASTTTGVTMSWETPVSAGGASRASGNGQTGGAAVK